MKDFSYITSSHPSYIEQLYQDFSLSPESIDPDLRKFFEGFDFAVTQREGIPSTAADAAGGNLDWRKELGVYRLILGYRNKGHLIAKTNPIRERKDRGANLDLGFFGLSEADMDAGFYAGNLIGLGTVTLSEIQSHLIKCYANHVGIEFKYISSQEKINFLTDEMETKFPRPLSLDKKTRILEKLNQGVIFEKFLHTKYIGQKRFSLEGGETTIAALDAMINIASDQGVQEVVIGMAHRGRLNVLANIMGKTYEHIFSEFEGKSKPDQTMGSGDVKYHLGYGSEVVTPSGKSISLKLMPNPSHLEAVDPVVLGFSRADNPDLAASSKSSVVGSPITAAMLDRASRAFCFPWLLVKIQRMRDLSGAVCASACVIVSATGFIVAVLPLVALRMFSRACRLVIRSMSVDDSSLILIP